MAVTLGQRFRALKDFDCDVTKSHYGTGLGYSVDNEALAQRVAKWIDEGKVEITTERSMLAGRGEVS